MIDSHAHLTYPRTDGLSIEHQIQYAVEQGVTGILDIGVNLSDIAPRQAALNSWQNVWRTVGVHPCHVGEEDLTPSKLAETLKKSLGDKQVVGIGETGIDLHYPDNPPLQQQIASFETHIKVAQETQMPLVIHSRDAEQETMQTLESALKTGSFQAVIHCFTGSAGFADWAIEHGFYLGATGIITYKKSSDLRQIFTNLPLERILIETDSPYLAPVPYRSKLNQPAYVTEVAKTLAETRNQPLETITQQTRINTQNLFKLE